MMCFNYKPRVFYKLSWIDTVSDKIFQPLAAVQEKKLILLLLRNIQHSPFSSLLAAFQRYYFFYVKQKQVMSNMKI